MDRQADQWWRIISVEANGDRYLMASCHTELEALKERQRMLDERPKFIVECLTEQDMEVAQLITADNIAL